MQNCMHETFLKMVGGGGMHSLLLILSPGSAPGHKLQKPSKDSGIV